MSINRDGAGQRVAIFFSALALVANFGWLPPREVSVVAVAWAAYSPAATSMRAHLQRSDEGDFCPLGGEFSLLDGQRLFDFASERELSPSGQAIAAQFLHQDRKIKRPLAPT